MASKTILVADDDFAFTQTLSLRLMQLGFSTIRSPDAMHALCETRKIHPDLIILDVNMPDGNGMAVCEMLATDPYYAKIPVIIHTGRSDEQTKRRCKDLGAYYVLKTPGAWDELKDLVCGLLDVKPQQTAASGQELTDTERPSLGLAVAQTLGSAEETPDGQAMMDCESPPSRVGETEQPTVLCIDDDPDVSKSIMIRLRPYGVGVQRAFKGMQGYWTALDTKPDVIILDLEMPDGEGNYVFGRLTDHSLLRDVPVIVLTGVTNTAVERTMLSMGVDAYLKKPLVFDELLRELQRHLTLSEKPLTHAHAGEAY